ncbi:hypothetical protein [Roseomonas rosulenta]|uniref:hypothetical protein n=1 Tax=Roseomonas rosulenta TaxID=2748667 RepID=UPI0018DF5AD1|nr:hypothetical protein [Roseomonas rosulenta]
MRPLLAAAFAGSLVLLAVAPARAQMDDGRCWVAVRVTGPDTMRVSEHEAEQRIRLRCRAGDALVFLTDTGQPAGDLVARWCDMARPFMVERIPEQVEVPGSAELVRAVLTMATCTYRGGPRMDR